MDALTYFLNEIGKTLEIDSLGRVWRFAAHKEGGMVPVPRRRAEHADSCGYLQLHTMNKYRRQYVVLTQRLVYAYFFGKVVPENLYIHHKDGNRQNNAPDNLEVLTSREHVNKPMHRKTFLKAVKARRKTKQISFNLWQGRAYDTRKSTPAATDAGFANSPLSPQPAGVAAT